jgi:hypothetical protein
MLLLSQELVPSCGLSCFFSENIFKKMLFESSVTGIDFIMEYISDPLWGQQWRNKVCP